MKRFVLIKYNDNKCYVYSSIKNERFDYGFYVGNNAVSIQRSGHDISVTMGDGSTEEIIDVFESFDDSAALNDAVVKRMITSDLKDNLDIKIEPTDEQCSKIIDAMWEEYKTRVGELSSELEKKC